MQNQAQNLNQDSDLDQEQNKNQEQPPKKEPFLLMAIKTPVIVLIFVVFGAVIVGGGYLIKECYKNATSWKTTDPVVRDKWIACNVDSDCYEYSPCNMGFSCLNKTGYEISIKDHVNVSCPQVEIMPWQSYRYNKEKCACSEGNCVKVFFKERYCKSLENSFKWCSENKPSEYPYNPEESECLEIEKLFNENCISEKNIAEEVSLTTDKAEYEQGEIVNITVKNDLNNPIRHLNGVGCGLQGFSNGEWTNLSSKFCKWDGEDKLKPNSEYNFDWTASEPELEKYRITFYYQEQRVINTKEIGKIICESKDIPKELEKLLLSRNWIKGNNKGCASCDACGCSCTAKDVWIVGGATIDINYVSCGGNGYTIKYKGKEYNCVSENYKPLYEQASLYHKVPEEWETIYSNEFTVKEKSALDARCGEKVKGIGYCRMMNMGYEFNLETGKCVMKEVSGCSAESPFDSLEECQKVCEEKLVCGWCGLHCVEYPISEHDCKIANGIFNKQCACPEVVSPHKIFLCSKENGKCVSKPIYTIHQDKPLP
ncbi:hypothetical protein KAR28_01200 [Candidatus Parcubacteria bacterium]|nr:hypothetical protein [Candidatus Parcubacteria bacterium]